MRTSYLLMKPAAYLFLGAPLFLYSRPVNAAVIVNATEAGGNVVFIYSGALNTSGAILEAELV